MQLSVHLLHNPIHWERYSGMFRNNLSGHVVTKYWGKGTNSLLPDVWLVVTVQRHSENTGTEFAMKESWGHLGIAISEVKKPETGEAVKGSWSKTPDLDKFCVIQCKVYWQKLKLTKLSQRFWTAVVLQQVSESSGCCTFHPAFTAQKLDLIYNQALKIWKLAVNFFSFHKIQQDCVKILGLFLW